MDYFASKHTAMLKDLHELVEAGILTEETAQQVSEYYDKKASTKGNRRLFVAFGILGAVLVGSGLILFIEHNWDLFSHLQKTIFAFIPLVLGQILCGTLLFRNRLESLWKEAASVFLFFSVGACIALISQIYHLKYSEEKILLIWMLLSIPIVYIMRSPMSSLLYIAGITWYGGKYTFDYHEGFSRLYWLLIAMALPYYINLLQRKSINNFTSLHNWFIPISMSLCLTLLTQDYDEALILMYFGYFSLIFAIGNSSLFSAVNTGKNGFKIIGFLGMLVILFISSNFIAFDRGFYKSIHRFNFVKDDGFIFALALIITSGIVTFLNHRWAGKSKLALWEYTGFIFLATYVLNEFTVVAVILYNIYIFAAGITFIFLGSKRNHLGLMNLGLSIIAVLAIYKFFESDLSYQLKGVLFMLVGAAFVTFNVIMLKRRRIYENQ